MMNEKELLLIDRMHSGKSYICREIFSTFCSLTYIMLSLIICYIAYIDQNIYVKMGCYFLGLFIFILGLIMLHVSIRDLIIECNMKKMMRKNYQII